jgi:hypothetical protein
MPENKMFEENVSAVNIGIKAFGDAVKAQGGQIAQVAWTPPVVDKKIAALLSDSELNKKIDNANQKAIDFILKNEVEWVGMKRLSEVVPGMKKNYILHSGPPIEWERMGNLLRKGTIGGILHEKLAESEDEAVALIEQGKVELHSAYDFDCIGAGVGIATYSMVTNVCRDLKTGKQGYCVPFEGRDGLAVWGMYNEKVEANLNLIEDQFAPAVDHLLANYGGINVNNIIAKALQMSDEIHTRLTADSLILVNEIAPKFMKSDLDKKTIKLCIDTLTSSERWFHPLGMASAMAMLKSIQGIDYCTLVTMNCSNGIENGIKIGALGNQWFITDAPPFYGQFFSSEWGQEDASLHVGDSTVCEVVGLGAFAGAAAPAVLRLRNGNYQDAINQTEEMKLISFAINTNYPIPLLDFSGPPLGIDSRKVLETGITPICHGGILSKNGGQIGAGAGRFPITNYIEAMKSFYKKYNLL